MKKLFLLFLLIQCGCECKTEKCGLITEIISTSKHGKVLVTFPSGEKKSVDKRRPKTTDIGTQYCECIEYK